MRSAVKWSSTVAALAILLGTGLFFLRQGSRPVVGEAQPEEPLPVTAVPLASRLFVLEGEYSARLSAVRDVTVMAKAGGTVEEDLIREGDHVAEGQSLYRLDDDTYRFAVQQSEAALDLARENLRKVQNASRPELLRRLEALLEESDAALKKAESDALRFAGLLEEGAVPLSQKEGADLALAAARSRAKVARENLEEARTGARDEDRAAAAAAVKQAEATFLMAQDTLENATVTSPLKGIVASKEVFAGDTVQPGRPMAAIVDISSFKINLGVPPADVSRFRRGDIVTVLPLSSGGPLSASVADVGVKADDKTGSFPVILRLPNPPGREPALRAGMDIVVRIVRERVEDALVVPVPALLRDREGASIFVVRGNRAERRWVEVGVSSESEAVLTAGAEEGELIAVVGQQRLRDGDLVEPTIEE